MIADTVTQKLKFAKRRLDDLKKLISDGELGSRPDDRQQLIQEFFFHLLGAGEYLAQLINKERALGIPVEDVAVHRVEQGLSPGDPVSQYISGLSANTRKEPFPSAPYSDDGLVYRVINYRNEIAHRNANPIHFSLSTLSAIFWLDPRDHSLGKSRDPIDVELSRMYAVFEVNCNGALAILK